MATTGFIPATLQKLWNVWNIRGFMIMSLTVQLVLALTSPLRQKTSNFIVILIVWSAYFLSDWTAIFAFGLISNAGCNKSPSYIALSEDLLALWASFLLIHLGGPDTITAFSLEDNALWLRHLVSLIAQVFAFFYIFVKTLPDNKLMGPVFLVFATGVIKYGERTRALYLASLENFKESTIKLLNQGDSVTLAIVEPGKEEDSDKKLVRVFHFFHIFKGLIVDIMPNHSQRHESREFFLKQDADSAYKFMSTELALLYEVFYTKIMAANSSWGVFIRNVAFYMSVTALVLFYINKKEELHTTDIWITYALLAGVIALDTVGEVMLTFSNWIKNKDVYLGCQIFGRCFFPFLMSMLMNCIVICLMSLCFGDVFLRSWSAKMGSFNLLVYSFNEGRPRNGCSSVCCCCRAIFGWIAKKIEVAEAISKTRYGSKISMDEGIWKYMFSMLQEKASTADEANKVREIYEARGELALRESSDELKRYVNDFEYDQTVLFWHIATEICYNTDQNIDKKNDSVKFSKTFSDYMIYLMVKQPDMMSAVAGIFQKRYRNTCGELMKPFEQRVQSRTLEEFCSSVLMKYDGSLEPGNKDRDDGRSVLIDSCRLANLLDLSERKWEVICGVWLELLSYAASHCRVVSHARLISEGGEFITFVWLTMAHLGIGPHFPKNYSNSDLLFYSCEDTLVGFG